MHIYKYLTPKGAQRYRVVVQDEGRRLSKAGLATEREAKRAGALLSIQLGKQPDPSQATLDDLIDLYLAQTDLAVTTRVDYEMVQRRLPSWMKAWKVENVTTMMIDQAYRALTTEVPDSKHPDKTWTAHRIRRVHEILNPAFALAARWGWVPVNPATSAKQPAKPETEIEVPSPEDVKTILDAADLVNPALGCALELAAHTGMRRGEICALQWKDLTDTEINVRRSISTTTVDPARVTTGKTGKGGHRKIPLHPDAVRSLRTHRARQAEVALGRGVAPSALKWIFTHDGARPWRTDYVTLAFTRIRDDVDIDVHLHSFRHFAATQWIAQGVDIRTVSYLLGHAKTSTTLDIYSAYLPARGREAADHMGNVLRRVPSS